MSIRPHLLCYLVTSLTVLLLFVPNVFALGEYTIAKIPDGAAITIDGKLTEAVWATAFSNQTFKLTPDNPAQNINPGVLVFDGPADFHLDFALIWDGTGGVYFAGKFYDDIHNAPNSVVYELGAEGYKDDGLQFWVSADYDASFYGDRTFELSYVLGFGSLNDPAQQYSGYWGWGNDGGTGKGYTTGNWTPDEAKTQGWHYQFSSNDGVNIDVECVWKWSSISLNYRGNASEGDYIGFDLRAMDNDGGYLLQGSLVWSELHHQKGTNPELHWVKIVLGSPLSILPVTQYETKLSTHNTNAIGIYDIFGKKIQPYQLGNHKGVRFDIQKNRQPVKRLITR